MHDIAILHFSYSYVFRILRIKEALKDKEARSTACRSSQQLALAAADGVVLLPAGLETSSIQGPPAGLEPAPARMRAAAAVQGPDHALPFEEPAVRLAAGENRIISRPLRAVGAVRENRRR